jgi:hypothetical protein
MTEIFQVINQSNNSFVLTNALSYTNINIFILIFSAALICLVLSIVFKDPLQRISLGIISILLSTASAFMSLNIAALDYSVAALEYNLSNNLSATYVSNLIVIPMSNILITLACVIAIVIGILIVIDSSLIMMMPKPTSPKSFNSEWWWKK